MPSTTYFAVADQYADWEDAITVTDTGTGTGMVFTGFTAKLQIRENISDTAALVTITETADASGGIALLSGGVVRWRVTASRLGASIPTGKNLHFDLLLFKPGTPQTVYCPVKGIVNVAPGATTP